MRKKGFLVLLFLVALWGPLPFHGALGAGVEEPQGPLGGGPSGTLGSAPRGEPNLRDVAQKEAALEDSVQRGTIWRYGEIIKKVVAPHERDLDRLFDFGPLMMHQGDLLVRPPVVTRAGAALRLTGEKSALGQRGSFKVVKKAALVSSPPNWRHYLLIGFPEVEAPHPSLLPQGQKEKALWKKRATLGFGVGVEEAESLWNSRVLELVRDFTGTLLFYELLAEGTIGGPQVKESTQASTRSNEELVLRLTEYGLVEEGGFLAAKPSPKSPPVKTF